MDDRSIALRAQDIYSGLRTVDQTSGLLRDLETTRVVGMAATVAANIKGIDVINDPDVLRTIAAQEWGIDTLALPAVLQVLEEVDYITVHRAGSRIVTVDEHIPLLHGDLYESLGEHFRLRSPTELDVAAVNTLDSLAGAPVWLPDLQDRLGDHDMCERLLLVGEAAQFTRRLKVDGGDDLVWSPYCGYEQPEALGRLFASFGDDEIRGQFERVRGYQGLPLVEGSGVLKDAVGHGILMANSIHGSGGSASFAFLPYRASAEQLRIQKVILDKALNLLACVRYGQHFATYGISRPKAIFEALLEPEGLRATTEASTQYRTAAQAQILRLERVGGPGWFRSRLIDTPDNVAAVRLALDLLEYGEPMTQRGDDDQRLLFTDVRYLTPLMTMKEHGPRARLDERTVVSLFDSFRGESVG